MKIIGQGELRQCLSCRTWFLIELHEYPELKELREHLDKCFPKAKSDGSGSRRLIPKLGDYLTGKRKTASEN